MPVVSIIFGALLIGVGLWGKYGTGTESPTALIPAVFGGLLVLCGAIGLVERLLKHAMHAAAMVGLLGFVGGMFNIGRNVGSDNPKPFTAPPMIATLLLTGLSALFVGLCVNSFIQARKRRQAREAAERAGVPS